jgi:SpoVK/Ycf46/Vps4 family AAA+-type ATPase
MLTKTDAVTRGLIFHSSTNNLNFLLLHEATLLGKWLQTFRQNVRVSFSKGLTSNTIMPVDDITKIFHHKVCETVSQ